MNDQQLVKNVDLRTIITERDLEGVVLSRLGALDQDSNFNSLNKYAGRVKLFQRLQKKFPDIKFLQEVIDETRRQGNFAFISKLDAQSQAVIKSSIVPVLEEIE